MRTKDELAEDMKHKISWKGGSSKSDFFNVAPIMKPKVLDPWAMASI